MKMNEIREIAKSHGIKPGKLSKTNLIKSIQIEEGNSDCFATALDLDCTQDQCRWRADCFKQSKKEQHNLLEHLVS